MMDRNDERCQGGRRRRQKQGPLREAPQQGARPRRLVAGGAAAAGGGTRKGAPAGSWLARMMACKPRMLVTVALANSDRIVVDVSGDGRDNCNPRIPVD